MTTPLLKKIQTIAAKTETTIGTPITLANVDGSYNAYDVDFQGEITVEEREGQGGFGRLPGVAGARKGTATFKTDLEWDGAAIPKWAEVLFPACGFVDDSNTFKPKSAAPGTDVKTITLATYEDGKKKFLAGAVGNFRIVMPSGAKCYIEWSFEGVWQPVIDSAILAPTYPADTVLRFASATATYDSDALCMKELVLDSGNEIIMRECPGTAAGFESALITDRYPMVTGDPEAALVANRDAYGQWLAGTEAAFSVVLDGPSNSDITISIPKAQIFNVNGSDRDKLLVEQTEWKANKNGATHDEEVSITFNFSS